MQALEARVQALGLSAEQKPVPPRLPDPNMRALQEQCALSLIRICVAVMSSGRGRGASHIT